MWHDCQQNALHRIFLSWVAQGKFLKCPGNLSKDSGNLVSQKCGHPVFGGMMFAIEAVSIFMTCKINCESRDLAELYKCITQHEVHKYSYIIGGICHKG